MVIETSELDMFIEDNMAGIDIGGMEFSVDIEKVYSEASYFIRLVDKYNLLDKGEK